MNERPLRGSSAGETGNTGAGPALRPVSPDETAPATGEPEPGGLFRGRGFLLLALALVVVLVVYGLELAHSRSLEARIVGLESELASAEQQLQAYEQRMGEVRAAVADLSERLAGLHELVRDPLRSDHVQPRAVPANP